ncbi:hypothetical protein [Gloeobacter kilaueensis]|uniref:Uncharacterized protein n=1 Tax=Gloeobacter kilaueensis (strain ATCC BAA-2537 / CCAP 1431/1 / ULC 316 / JS1) TaxID=1183438 RepID=U5QLD9_GLOK1|nr:hypothetical protein [Gloeobacter kilaueensis]AGY59703.1 hypothetical protein GKIL_3457 [Gloeobacter kilaueensis JS1]
MFSANAMPQLKDGRVELDLEFKSFFVNLVERSYREGLSLVRIKEDIATVRRELEVAGLAEMPLEQWAEEAIFALKRRENLPLRAVDANANLAVCKLCGKVGPYRETNCASFCPYGI